MILIVSQIEKTSGSLSGYFFKKVIPSFGPPPHPRFRVIWVSFFSSKDLRVESPAF
jgi:hypothetical protein